MKQDLRKLIKVQLGQIDLVEYGEKSNQISKVLFKELAAYKTFDIGVFYPLNDEPNWLSSLKGDEQLLFVKMQKDLNLKFFVSSKSELVEKSEYGRNFFEPSSLASEGIPKVVLVPGLLFDKQGNRLGRGKGYYDRYLESFGGLKIGICFELQLKDLLPVDSHDQKVDWIITEKQVLKIKK